MFSYRPGGAARKARASRRRLHSGRSAMRETYPVVLKSRWGDLQLDRIGFKRRGTPYNEQFPERSYVV